MSEQEQASPAVDPTAPSEQTSLRWPRLEGVFDRLEAFPQEVANNLGANRAAIAGLAGVVLALWMGFTFLIQPLNKMPFGTPYAHTPRTAQHYLPHTALGKLKSRKQAGWPRYIAAYVGSYFIPYMFSARFKQIDLLMMVTRGLLIGLVLLISVRLFFTEPEEAPDGTPDEAPQQA